MRNSIRRSFSKPIIILCITLIAFASHSTNSLADQIIFNGDFSSDIGSWKLDSIDKGVRVVWDRAGCPQPGSVLFITKGRKKTGEGSAIQQFSKNITAGTSGKLTLCW
jgi:hypothetical protein